MNLRSHLKRLFTTILGLFCTLVATTALAGFQVSEYQSQEPYGNAEIPCFRGAIAGGRRVLTDEEEAQILASLPIKETGHFYGRFSVNSGPMSLSGIKNKLTNTSLFPSGVATTQKVRQNQTGLELALGYFYTKNIRFELEYLINKNFSYQSVPVLTFTGTTPTGWTAPRLNAELKNNTILFNGYYETMFAGYDRFHPFLTFGVGIALNSIRSSVTPTQAPLGPPGTSANPGAYNSTKRKGSLAIGGGGGFRFMVFQRVALVASIRYISLGTAIVQPVPGLQLSGHYSRIPVSLGLIYLF